MNGATFILELHGWRGLHRNGGPLGSVLTIGWVSVSFIPFLLSDWLSTRAVKLRNVLKGSGFPEMDAFGEKE